MSLSKFVKTVSVSSAESHSPSDLGKIDEKPVQPRRSTYAPAKFGKKQRDFQASWYNGRDWLEFSMEKKAAYCYCCRHFSTQSADKQFILTGYTNWRHALESNRGLNKHSTSAAHVQAMVIWKERELRRGTDRRVSTLVNENQLEKNRYYVRSIAQVVQFLCINELPLRGDKKSGMDTLDQESMDEPSGLFLRLFEYTMQKDEKLRNIFRTVPKNASYTSAMVQNELIEIMKNVVLRRVVSDVKSADIPWYTLKSDGTRDPTNTENISIAVRFVKEGKVYETLVAMPTSEQLDADSLTIVILDSLEGSGLETTGILSQCYDGASVMSGKNGGVQKIVQERLRRDVPYVHCFNHQLHLVVVHAIGERKEVEKFFGTCRALYNFVRRPKLDRLYDGTKLKRLLEQRWTGHLATTSAILENHQHLVDLLETCEEAGCDSSVCIEAAGLTKQLRSKQFMFIAHCVHKLLTILQPVDKLLQCRDCDITAGIRLISSTLETIKQLREHADETCDSITQELPKYDVAITGTASPKRQRKLPTTLRDSVVLSSVGHHSESRDNDEDEKEIHKRILIEMLDSCIGEISTRFAGRNCALSICISKLWPENDGFLEVENIQELSELIGLDTKSSLFAAECLVAKNLILKEFDPTTHKGIADMCTLLYPFRAGFSSVYQLYAAALTFGASSAVCEASFSTLTRVLTSYRRSMTHQRKSNLVLLAFLHEYTKAVDFDEILRDFAKNNRKIQLY